MDDSTAPAVVEDRPRDSHPPAGSEVELERRWIARASLGHQWVRQSEQQRLLEEDGYGSSRWLALASADFFVLPPFGVGIFAGISWRNDAPDHGGPELRETIVLAGFEAPFVFGGDAVYLCLAPRVGYTRGTLSLHEGGNATDGIMFGGEATALVPTRRGALSLDLGVSLGVFFARTDPPGAIGGQYDLGGIHLSLTGGLGG